MQFIIDEVCALANINDETYFKILEPKVISEITIEVEELSQSSYANIEHIGCCNFFVSNDLNQTILNMLNGISIKFK
jgi:hypothetical protein